MALAVQQICFPVQLLSGSSICRAFLYCQRLNGNLRALPLTEKHLPDHLACSADKECICGNFVNQLTGTMKLILLPHTFAHKSCSAYAGPTRT